MCGGGGGGLCVASPLYCVSRYSGENPVHPLSDSGAYVYT